MALACAFSQCCLISGRESGKSWEAWYVPTLQTRLPGKSSFHQEVSHMVTTIFNRIPVSICERARTATKLHSYSSQCIL